jgi:hypothetical protein
LEVFLDASVAEVDAPGALKVFNDGIACPGHIRFDAARHCLVFTATNMLRPGTLHSVLLYGSSFKIHHGSGGDNKDGASTITGSNSSSFCSDDEFSFEAPFLEPLRLVVAHEETGERALINIQRSSRALFSELCSQVSRRFFSFSEVCSSSSSSSGSQQGQQQHPNNNPPPLMAFTATFPNDGACLVVADNEAVAVLDETCQLTFEVVVGEEEEAAGAAQATGQEIQQASFSSFSSSESQTTTHVSMYSSREDYLHSNWVNSESGDENCYAVGEWPVFASLLFFFTCTFFHILYHKQGTSPCVGK